jgi:hypothetical protein
MTVPARPRPPIDLTSDDEWTTIVIRTDYSDDAAWQFVATALQQRWPDDDFEPCCHLVDDSGWAGAEPGEVLAVLPEDPPAVVFLADAAAMRGEHPVLAVTTNPDVEDEDSDIPGLGSSRQFRLLPAATAEMVGNLALSNMDYADFSRSAHGDSEKIHRGFS